MRFAIFHAVLLIIVLWRFVLPLAAKRPVKLGLAALYVLGALYPFVVAVFKDGLLSPEFPNFFMTSGSVLSAFLLVTAAVTVAREAVIFLAVLAGRSGVRVHKAVQQDRRSVLTLGAASAGIAAFGVWEGVRLPTVVRHDIPIKNLPAELEGFSFVQLSDIHCSALLNETHMRKLVARVNALSPELILITGDIADGKVASRLSDIAPLADLRAPLGVWGCDGNHEHYLDYDNWVRHFDKIGIRMLRNQHAVLHTKSGGTIVLGGIADPHAARFGRELPDVVKTFEDSPDERDGALRILMAHQPKRFSDYRAAAPFSLQLSGHTHGGQIWGMDKAVAVMNGLFVRGLYKLDDGTRMYVHPGSGLWNGFAIRLGVPSEIALHRLVRAVDSPTS